MNFKKDPGQRGKWAEKEMKKFLDMLSGKVAEFDFERIYDARSAGGRFPKRPGDYVFYRPGVHGLIEVKEVEHDFRLPAANMTQIPSLMKRALAGGVIIVLVYHTTIKAWRHVPLKWLAERSKQPSWDLREFHAFPDLGAINLYQVLTGALGKAGS